MSIGNNIVTKAQSYKGQRSTTFTSWRGVSDATAWCCIFVCFVLEKCGINVPGKPMRCDYLDQALMKMGGKWVKLADAQPGDVVLFTWSGGGHNTGRGSRDHVGFFVRHNGAGSIITVEGNTSGSKVDVKPRSTAYVYKIIRLPAVAAGWVQDANGWWYRRNDGSYPKNEWEQLSGKWYWFDASGYMVTGWKKVSNAWYYLAESGAMVTGWKSIGGKWYHFDPTGAMQTGWIKDKGKWYYLHDSGDMIAGTMAQVGNYIYAFDAHGAMLEGEITAKADKNGRVTLQ